jgi:hypothetical protein
MPAVRSTTSWARMILFAVVGVVLVFVPELLPHPDILARQEKLSEFNTAALSTILEMSKLLISAALLVIGGIAALSTGDSG